MCVFDSGENNDVNVNQSHTHTHAYTHTHTHTQSLFLCLSLTHTHTQTLEDWSDDILYVVLSYYNKHRESTFGGSRAVSAAEVLTHFQQQQALPQQVWGSVGGDMCVR
jgi:hypothetical protein